MWGVWIFFFIFKGGRFFSSLFRCRFIVIAAVGPWWTVHYRSQLDFGLLDSSVVQHDLWGKDDGEVDSCVDEDAAELTSLSQSLKAEMRVKTVGFFTSLQVREETKLVTPWTNHLPSWPKQFRGPPESPWRQDKGARARNWLPSQLATPFFAVPHTHCIQTRRLHPHRSWWSWRRSPTSRFGCTRCVPPRAAGPAAAYLASARGLRGRAEPNDTHIIHWGLGPDASRRRRLQPSTKRGTKAATLL